MIYLKKYIIIILMNKLIELNQKINEKLTKLNEDNIKRKRKTDIFDAVAFKLLYTKKNSSQPIVTAKLNNHTGRSIARSSYADRESSLGIKFYEDLYESISSYISRNCHSRAKKQIIAVDGTHTNVNMSMATEEFKPDKGKNSFDLLISGVYNVTYNYPVALDMVKHKNERKAFIDFSKNYKT